MVAAARTVASEAGTIVREGGTAGDAANVARSMANLAQSSASAGSDIAALNRVLENVVVITQKGGVVAATDYAAVVNLAATTPQIVGSQVLRIADGADTLFANIGDAGIKAALEGIQAASRGGGADMVQITYIIADGVDISLTGGATQEETISVVNRMVEAAKAVRQSQDAIINSVSRLRINTTEVYRAAVDLLPRPAYPPPPFTEHPSPPAPPGLSAEIDLSHMGQPPGTPGAQANQAPVLSDEAGGPYLKLESDIEHGADQKTVQADAEQVKSLAERNGNTHLVDATNAILTGIGNGSYDQVGAEEALMNDGTTPEDVVGSFSADETSAYQKLISDIRSGADNTTLMNDVFSLSEASIQNSDFGTGQAALDIGFSIKGGTFDPNTALQALGNAAPGTSAAQLPPIATPALTVGS